eukprot:3012436-Pleurochrysis_carterae.AAC.5
MAIRKALNDRFTPALLTVQNGKPSSAFTHRKLNIFRESDFIPLRLLAFRNSASDSQTRLAEGLNKCTPTCMKHIAQDFPLALNA